VHFNVELLLLKLLKAATAAAVAGEDASAADIAEYENGTTPANDLTL
jgi:hypothetical protein